MHQLNQKLELAQADCQMLQKNLNFMEKLVEEKMIEIETLKCQLKEFITINDNINTEPTNYSSDTHEINLDNIPGCSYTHPDNSYYNVFNSSCTAFDIHNDTNVQTFAAPASDNDTTFDDIISTSLNSINYL